MFSKKKKTIIKIKVIFYEERACMYALLITRNVISLLFLLQIKNKIIPILLA